MLDVIGDHTVSAEPPPERGDRVFHHFDPLHRESVFVTVEEGRDDFVFENLEQGFVIAGVGDIHVGVGGAVADSETVGTVVPFVPPPVEDGEVQSAVQDRLLSGGTGRFEGTTRVVKPNVDALNEVARNVDIVVFEEDDAICEAFFLLDGDEALDDVLTGHVSRVSFPGEDELNRAFGIVDDLVESFFVLNDEVSALVGGEPTRETNGQGVRIEDVFRGFDSLRIGVDAFELFGVTLTREVDEEILQRGVSFPEFAGVDIVNL